MLCPNCQVSFLEMKVKSLWLAELKIAQNCSCNWRTRCPAREKSETLEVKRKSSGLLQYLSKHRLAFWNIYSIVHSEEIQNRVPHRSHPPTPFSYPPWWQGVSGWLMSAGCNSPSKLLSQSSTRQNTVKHWWRKRREWQRKKPSISLCLALQFNLTKSLLAPPGALVSITYPQQATF